VVQRDDDGVVVKRRRVDVDGEGSAGRATTGRRDGETTQATHEHASVLARATASTRRAST
jgi:hypothetical protein